MALCTNTSRTDKIMPFVIRIILDLDSNNDNDNNDNNEDNDNNNKDDNDNNERPAIKDDNNLMKELYKNIEMLNYQNVMDLEEYINYSDEKIITGIMSNQKILNQATYQESEQAENNEEDDSVEILQITHKEALDAIN
ncbi:14787_t:CDS:2 [Gigaspora margarita]|uniref:14787_t:CDS:1 n=1 Tax=Gigaspora margarita TaxID=4874 RepID=A0ABN7VBG9_GIGMA|nr:14787_t:CDS:2 [Gigaspora margarita]